MPANADPTRISGACRLHRSRHPLSIDDGRHRSGLVLALDDALYRAGTNPPPCRNHARSLDCRRVYADSWQSQFIHHVHHGWNSLGILDAGNPQGASRTRNQKYRTHARMVHNNRPGHCGGDHLMARHTRRRRNCDTCIQGQRRHRATDNDAARIGRGIHPGGDVCGVDCVADSGGKLKKIIEQAGGAYFDPAAGSKSAHP